MPVTIVKDDDDFKVRFGAAGPKTTICYFTAAWCGPCKQISPTYDALSNQYLNAVFLKIDVDICEGTCASYGVSSMPTFIVFKDGAQKESIKGADRVGLEALVKKYAEDSTAGSLVAGQSDLKSIFDKKQMECLNGSDDTPLDLFVEGNCNLVSDCDEQLIISFPFHQPVKVHSILIKGVGERSPKRVKVFINLPKTIDFDNAAGLEPTQLIEFDKSATEGQGQIVQTKYVKFQNVQNIQFFIEDNIGGGDVTELVQLAVFGTPLSSVNMSEFKRVAGKAGDAH
uniref:Thioredoxin-like protein 1 n=1 Tax=Caenorhabditis japonica TaxID=281687 RepID=A0A8R1HNG8_CAEJA